MARPKVPSALRMQQVSGNPVLGVPQVVTASSSVYRQGRKINYHDDRQTIAQPWQREAYRHVHICGEARYAVTLFANLAGRAEIGVSEPQALNRKAVWVESGPEVEAFSELAPTVRDRTKLVRDYMLHRSIAGECYLIARDRRETDPPSDAPEIWEIVAVTELRRIGPVWQVRLDNNNFVDLAAGDPIIRMWNPDPENRREAWSPMRSLLPTLREIEWETGHIFTQIRSRLMSAGVWFLPNNLTYPAPPPDAVEGGAEGITALNEAELFGVALAASGSYELDLDEVSFPTVVMADPAALEAIDQKKLIKFWSEIDGEVMKLRSDAIRRFALGWDLPPEQVLGSSGLAVSGGGGSAGSVNHWGEWANEEKTIAGHIEPALDDLVATLTSSFLRLAVPGTDKVIGYNDANMRMKQDRSKEALELHDRGLLKGEVTVREVGFDPAYDMMDSAEFRQWLLIKMVGGSPSPEMMVEALKALGTVLNVPESGSQDGVSGNHSEPKALPGRSEPRSLKEHPVQGPPQVQHDHSPAPYALAFTPLHASAEGLVLRALEKAGARLLNDGKRGRDRDRRTPPHLAHLTASVETVPEFDFSMLPLVLGDLPAGRQARINGSLIQFCSRMYREGIPYTRDALVEVMEGL